MLSAAMDNLQKLTCLTVTVWARHARSRHWYDEVSGFGRVFGMSCCNKAIVKAPRRDGAGPDMKDCWCWPLNSQCWWQSRAKRRCASALHHFCFLNCKMSCGAPVLVLVIVASRCQAQNKIKCFLRTSYACGGSNSSIAKASNVTLPVGKYCTTV